MAQTIKIVEDFHPYPAGRYPADGEGNGTSFREKFLVPALKEKREVIIDLDGAPGYPVSFLEEAFGGLVREGFSPEAIRQWIEVVAKQPGFERYLRHIEEHITVAEQQSSAKHVH
ncbi:MAG: STAS-like domain-containing protein [Marinovum sp.]|nr:STAS-like domain-containing protein [Marinovum sp.]